MAMSKLVILHHLLDNDDRPGLERWFWQHHCPEVLAQVPWTTRYVLYRPVPAPPGAEAFGYVNYRVHENYVRDPAERRGVRGLMSMTPCPGAMNVAVINVPAEPTEDFHGAALRPGDSTILRWLTAFRYPDGVSEQGGEEWYLNVHVPEVCRQPGLLRFFSHKAYNLAGPPLPSSNAQRPFVAQPSPLTLKKWHRVSEQWYANDSAWVNAVLKNPPAYTRPAWATQASYPFLAPWQDFLSTFLLERPDCDLLEQCDRRYF